ncbi:outer membrane lipoprotein-sorting protein [Calditrichota bacterium]
MKTLFLILISLTLQVTATQGKTAEEWLKSLDHQLFLRSASYSASMVVHTPNGDERTFKFDGKVVGSEFALMEYTEPPRQKGTRYLKSGDALWIYFPRQDRTMQIQGHMLRQGVQGGDMSFEDMTESKELLTQYEVTIGGETDTSVTLALVSHDMTVSYPYREIVLDKRNSLPISIMNRDASGNPLKMIKTLKTKQIGNRYYPVSTEIRSMLVKDKWTRFDVDNLQFDVVFSEDTFTKRGLER